MRKLLTIFFASALFCLAFSACGKNEGSTMVEPIKRKTVDSTELQFTTPTAGDTIAIFNTSMGEFRAVLYPAHAPIACENFITLAGTGFYNNAPFDTRVSGRYIQSSKNADGQTSTIWDDNPYPIETSNQLHHYAGALCAPLNEDALASSPFYIVQSTPDSITESLTTAMKDAGYTEEVIATYQSAGGEPTLDYTDTIFGHVYEGMDIIDAIAQSAEPSASTSSTEQEGAISELCIYEITIATYTAK